MKKMSVFLFVGLFLFGATGIAGAALFQEEFQFGTNGWLIGDGGFYAKANFDIVDTGNQAKYYNIFNQLIRTTNPVEDASGYIVGTGITSATLNVGIYSDDTARDPVQIQARLTDHNDVTLYETVLNLNDASTDVDIDLPANVIDYITAHGELVTVFLSPIWYDGHFYPDHDYILKEAELEVNTVPEPSTLLFLLSGVFGVIGLGRVVRN